MKGEAIFAKALGFGLIFLLIISLLTLLNPSPVQKAQPRPGFITASLDTSWNGGCVDGDTCQFITSRGTWRVRLARVDAPELTGLCREDALRSRQALLSLLDQGQITLDSIREDYYGRVLAEVVVRPRDVSPLRINASDYLVSKGLAVTYPGEPCLSRFFP